MNALLRTLLVGLIAATLTVACSKETDEAAADAKAEMGQALEATKDAASAAATDAQAAVVETAEEASAKTEALAADAKESAVDAVKAAKEAAHEATAP